MFARGLDINISSFPSRDLIKRFDAFMCHGRIDSEIIKSKTKKPIKIIGYPRYDISKNDESERKSLINEFALDIQKQTILWIPSRLDWEQPNFQNIIDWLDVLDERLLNKQIILRPHPHCLQADLNLIGLLKTKNIRIDDVKGRKLSSIYRFSDLIISDYGGSIFSATYMCKPIILLNSKNHNLINVSNELDIKARNRFLQFNLNEKNQLRDFLSNFDLNMVEKHSQISLKNKLELFGNPVSLENYQMNEIFNNKVS